MAVDAINVLETCYLTAVRYYLANLGMTMESQVRSSVYLRLLCLFSLLCLIIYSVHPKSLFLVRLAVCRASLSIKLNRLQDDLVPLVAAHLSRTRILAVTNTPNLLYHL